ncbi:MAG: winged helix-turn-helix domain-containing protein [Gemmatimonadota bacterium]
MGDLFIDTARRTVRRGEREIELTAREFAFLVHLARNAGRVVPRDEIMDRVWHDSRPSSNVIDVYASRLRGKIDADSDTSLLVTHHGVGYALEADASSSEEARDTEA